MTNVITKAERDALATLAKNHRLFVVLVPEGVPDGFVARLTAWSNFALDTRMVPPIPVPVAKQGDGLVCPYCGAPARVGLDSHVAGCDYREALERWGRTSMQIDEQFGPEV